MSESIAAYKPQEKSPSGNSADSQEKKFAEFCERLEAAGYVKGFAGGLNQEYKENDHSLARVIAPILISATEFMRENFNDARISTRYSCDSKHNSIVFAVLLPEEIYLPKHGEIFEFLNVVENVFYQIPQLAGYFFDSRTITFSDGSPLDIRAVERDFPFYAE